MCGIFGIIQECKKHFDREALITLGCNNDARGGDSCGIFIDDTADYGVEEQRLFSDFYSDSTLLNNTEEGKVILGHCRKASVGGISMETAQPAVVYDDFGEPVYALVHNGTILNYRELAQKYIPDVDINGMTDSQVMAYIFYHRGYEVLGEYLGAGMFVMYDIDKNRVYMFKGKSKKTPYRAEAQVERPCYYCVLDKDIVFSSLRNPLQDLFKEEKVNVIPTNKLLLVHCGVLMPIKVYNRSDRYQKCS